jgi:hypothetical protein
MPQRSMRLLMCLGVLTSHAFNFESPQILAQMSNSGPEGGNDNAAQSQLRAQALMEQGGQLYRAKNYAAAVPVFLEAAKLGNAAAQLQVGWHYEFGKGVRRNLKKAFRWYLAAGLRETLCGQPDCS